MAPLALSSGPSFSPFSYPAPGYAIVGTEMAPPKKTRSRGGFVPAAVAPTRDAETCKGRGVDGEPLL